jgi:hypothetical protein
VTRSRREALLDYLLGVVLAVLLLVGVAVFLTAATWLGWVQ